MAQFTAVVWVQSLAQELLNAITKKKKKKKKKVKGDVKAFSHEG